MFTNFHIERFRGIPALEIDGVKPITLLVGKNNTGKTSVLEAIFLLCGATNPYMPAVLGQLRGQRITTAGDADSVWRSLFQGMACKEPIEIMGWWNREGPRTLYLEPLDVTTYSDDPSSQLPGAAGEVGGRRRIGGLRLRYERGLSEQIVTQAVFDPLTRQVVAPAIQRDDFVRGTLLSSRSFFNLARDTEQYSFLVRIRREEEVVEALRLIDPRVKGLAVVSEASGATVYADIGGDSLVPLVVCGEGMLRLFTIVLAVTSSRGGVLLIDEIDNGLHHTVMKELWPVLRKLCAEHSVQLIATTHNEEILRYAITAFATEPDLFGIFRLDRVADVLKATRYEGEVLGAVNETGWEIRG
jgi:predicted ATPase